MVDLLFIMFERVGTIIAVAFILTRFKFFKQLINRDKLHGKQEVQAILFFAMFGIAGTYLGFTWNTSTLQFESAIQGVVTEEAIANSRVIGIVIAGLLGGYRVGLGVGLIAGLHRMTLGGFTAISCGLSTIISGVIAGYFSKKKQALSPLTAFLVGAFAEALQMGIILLISKPFDMALSLVQVIGLPMILANGVGTAIFMLIIQSVIGQEKRVIADEAEKTLNIADQTITYLRQGLTKDTAQAVCDILHKELRAVAVAMTNKTHVLAHAGTETDPCLVNMPIQTDITKQVLASGHIKSIKNETALHKANGTIVAPLRAKRQTLGTLKVYYNVQHANDSITIEFIRGLSNLLSEQMEIGEAERMLQLAREAEINALQAQVNPHFLFNTMHMIISLIRTNPEEARTLLGELSSYIRKNVTGTSEKFTTMKEELSHVKSYLSLIEARFVDRLHVNYELDFSTMTSQISPFTLQPLVENAINHGFSHKATSCELTISITEVDDHIQIKIIDNGRGIPQERLDDLLHNHVASETGTGIGLYNVNRRLVKSFGEKSQLTIQSKETEGTEVSFIINAQVKEEIA